MLIEISFFLLIIINEIDHFNILADLVPDLRISNDIAFTNNVNKTGNYVFVLDSFYQQTQLINYAKKQHCAIANSSLNFAYGSLPNFIKSQNLFYSKFEDKTLRPGIQDAILSNQVLFFSGIQYVNFTTSLPKLNESAIANVTLIPERISSNAQTIEIKVNRIPITFAKPFDQLLGDKEFDTKVEYLVLTELNSDIRTGQFNTTRINVNMYAKTLSCKTHDFVIIVPVDSNNFPNIPNYDFLMNQLDLLVKGNPNDIINMYRNLRPPSNSVNFSMPDINTLSIHNTYKIFGKRLENCLKSLDALYDNIPSVQLSHLLQVSHVWTNRTVTEEPEYFNIPNGVTVFKPFLYFIINRKDEEIIIRGRYQKAPKGVLKSPGCSLCAFEDQH